MGNSLERCCLPPKLPSIDGDDENLRSRTNRVELAATKLFSIPGLATAYHTSVVVNGEEFFFSDSGIYSDRAMTSHQGSPTELFDIGMSAHTGAHLYNALCPYFMAGTYDLIRKNCNSFSDCALYYLLHQRLDSKYSMLERMGQRASTDLIQRFTKSMYEPNKAADSFRPEEVVAMLDKLGDDVPVSQARTRHAFSLYTRVTVVGLKSVESLNGQGAEIVRYNGINGRWEARLFATGEVKAFRAENLRPAGELVLEPGDRVRIHSLTSDVGQELNGLEAEVVKYLPDRSRYEIRLFDTGELKGLRSDNLQALRRSTGSERANGDAG